MASQWFCKILGQEVGPVGFPDMAEMVRKGTLKEDDPVRREGTSQWIRAREVVGLFRAAAKEPAQTQPKPEPKPVPPPSKQEQAEPPPPEPRGIGRQRARLAGALVVVLVLLAVGVSVWRASRRERFPAPYRGERRPSQRDVLAALAEKRASRGAAAVPKDSVPEAVDTEHAPWKDRYTQDFRQGFDTQSLGLLAMGGSGPEQYVSFEPAGLRVTIPANCPVWHCSADPKIRVKGDFQITARYTILDLERPTEGFGAGVSLFVESAEGDRAGMGRKRSVHKGHIFNCYRGIRLPDGSYKTLSPQPSAPGDELSGWLRLTRVAEQIAFEIAEPGGERFVELFKTDFPKGDLVKIRLAAQTGRSPTVVDAVWSYVDVQAEELVKMYASGKGSDR